MDRIPPKVFVETDPEVKAIVFGPPAMRASVTEKIREVLRGTDRKTADKETRAEMKRKIEAILKEEGL